MSKFLIAGLVAACAFSITATNSSAAVRVRGVRGTAVVTPRGAVVVRRPMLPRRTTVVRGPRRTAIIRH